ncbi:MAG: hypothetical protein EB060_02855 [Proteobacteria bacterium]|nr:hypothetical protein [Pseudomonadota bacterium]
MRRLHIILAHERIHEENRRKIKEEEQTRRRGFKRKLTGGFAVPQKEELGDKVEKWRERVDSMRSKMRSGREQARNMWKGR